MANVVSSFVDRDMFMRYLGGGVGHLSTRYLTDRFRDEAQPPAENDVDGDVVGAGTGEESEVTDRTEILGEEEEEEGDEEEEEENDNMDALGPEDGENGDDDTPENEGYGTL